LLSTVASHHKPEVQRVFALVVVIGPGVRRYLGRHLRRALGRHGHGAQQGAAADAGRPDAADAADDATPRQLGAGLDHFIFGSAQRLTDLRKRPIRQWKTALPFVQQAGMHGMVGAGHRRRRLPRKAGRRGRVGAFGGAGQGGRHGVRTPCAPRAR